MNRTLRAGWFAVIAVAVLAASACGGGSSPRATPAISPGDGASPTAPVAHAGATATGPALAPCTTADLALTATTAGAAAGTHFLTVTLTNTSGAACSLAGFPGVSLIDGAGEQLGAPADRNPAITPAEVTLDPGRSAHTVIGIPNYQNFPEGRCTGPSTALKVYPPDDYTALTVPIADYSCPGFSVQAITTGTGGATG